MARFHAASWGRTDDARYAWITLHANAAQIEGMQAGFALGWPRFARELRDLVPDSVLAWGERVGPSTGAILRSLCRGPLAICHADFRLENMFFGRRPEHPRFAILDWQSITKSAGPQDLAYFLTQSVKLEVRRAHERALIDRYLQGLRAAGVRDYSAERCWEDYRRATLYLLDYAVTIAATLDLANERGAAVARALSARSCAALADLQCEELLPRA